MLIKDQELELVQKAKKGNEKAQTMLYEKYYRQVWQHSYVILKDDSSAHDMAQDVFFKVFVRNKIRNFRGQTSMAGWLFRITRNVCLSELRLKKRAATAGLISHPVELLEGRLVSKAKNAEEILDAEKQIAAVRHALSKLPALYRESIKYRYFMDYSYKEAARLLGITPKYYGICVLRAKMKLTALLTAKLACRQN